MTVYGKFWWATIPPVDIIYLIEAGWPAFYDALAVLGVLRTSAGTRQTALEHCRSQCCRVTQVQREGEQK